MALKIDEVRDATTSEVRDKALGELDALRTTTSETTRAREICLEVYRKLSAAQSALAKFDPQSKDLAGLLKTEEDLGAARARMPECEDAIGALKLAR